ncbi:MAG TPA: cytochrome c oxidase subunit 4 [Acidimicrobiales bacterium]|nr:cytochrome c oxidase subunit 4 [Acidimicrobiales bacterium]
MTLWGRMMLAVAGFLVLLSAVYWFLSYEEAGSILLLLAAGLALVTGAYLVASTRQGRTAEPGPGGSALEAEGEGAEASGLYLPHASVWPLGVGIGSVVLANGLALGLWAVVPGAIVLTGALVGYARQSRHRD